MWWAREVFSKISSENVLPDHWVDCDILRKLLVALCTMAHTRLEIGKYWNSPEMREIFWISGSVYKLGVLNHIENLRWLNFHQPQCIGTWIEFELWVFLFQTRMLWQSLKSWYCNVTRLWRFWSPLWPKRIEGGGLLLACINRLRWLRVCYQSQGMKNVGQRWPEAHQKACDKGGVAIRDWRKFLYTKNKYVRTRVCKGW